MTPITWYLYGRSGGAKKAAEEIGVKESASGDIAVISDGADDVAIKSLVAEITPVQDLNGQANPYPAGGGNNLLNPEVFVQREGYNNLSVSSSGNVITITGYNAGGRFACFNVPTTVGQSYTVKLTARNNVTTVSVVESDTKPTAWISGGTAVGVNAACTYTATKAWAQVWVELSANNATVTNLQFEKGSSATDWSPYENICPISGRTGLTVTQEAGNLLDGSVTWAEGKAINAQGQIVDNSGTRYSSLIPVENGKTYVLRFTGSGFVTRIHGYNASDTWVQQVKDGGTSPQEFTISNSNVTAIRISTGRAGLINVQSLRVRVNAIPITWETEAGTVYGGTLDVISGVLTVDKAIVDISTLQWFAHNTYGFYSNNIRRTVKRPSGNNIPFDGISSIYKTVSLNQEPTTDYSVAVDSTGTLYIKDTRYSTAAELIAASSGVTICYPLATPQTYQLTPTEVRTLLGGNNIYTDAGDVTVEYVADTKMYIDNKIAELQALVLENN